MSEKQEFEQDLKRRLEEWQVEIAKLKAKAEQAAGEAQLAYYKELEELRAQQDEARDKLDELRTASDAAWDDLRAGVEQAWSDMSKAVKKAMSRFSGGT